MSEIRQTLQEFCKDRKIINTHCHHRPEEFQTGLGLNDLLRNTYVSWCGIDFNQTPESKREYLRLVRFNAYFHWVEIALKELCDLPQELTEKTWDTFDNRIRENHKTKDYHLNILKDRCCYEKIILDSYWNPGSNEGHLELFTPTYRINMFLFGYNTRAKDHNGNNPFKVYHWPETLTFDEYLGQMEEQITSHIQSGCVAVKSALAYDRGLDFSRATKEKAQKGYMNPLADAEEIKAFQDYTFFEICRIAADRNVPLQCHTGLGKLEKSNAMQMQEVIAGNPDTKFVLFHGSYPWIQDVCGLIHNYPNVYADICWLPIISGNACETLLKELIEVGTTDRVMWGCDTWTSEESYGAMLAGKNVLAEVFSQYVDKGYLSQSDAQEYIDCILYKNAKKLFSHLG